MKNIIKTMVVGVAATGMLLASSVMAADQKIAVVNLQEVMGSMPQAEEIGKALDLEFKFSEDIATLTQMDKDIKYYEEKLKRDGPVMTQKEKDDLTAQINGLKAKGGQLNMKIQQNQALMQRKAQAMLLKLIQQASKNIGMKEGYDFIFPEQTVLFAKPEVNITASVIDAVSKLK